MSNGNGDDTPKDVKKNKALIRGDEYFSIEKWNLMKVMADTIIKSKAVPKSIENAAQMMMVLQAGYEKGMKPVESMNSFYIVNGKITMWGSSVIARVKKAGYKIKWDVLTDEKVNVTLEAPDGSMHEEAYTMGQAQKAGLASKDIWKKYPQNMLRFKALGNAIKFFCPEVMENTYITEDAMDNVPSSVEVVDGEIVNNKFEDLKKVIEEAESIPDLMGIGKGIEDAFAKDEITLKEGNELKIAYAKKIDSLKGGVAKNSEDLIKESEEDEIEKEKEKLEEAENKATDAKRDDDEKGKSNHK